MKVDIDRIRKYNVSGPRYTSYPTAVQFREQFSSTSLENYLLSRNEKARDISLYFHIPFCFSLCWYCGCTKIITRDQDRADVYLDYLKSNMDQLLPILNNASEVTQIHFGGGTPTFLDPGQIHDLGESIKSRFKIGAGSENSIEIDPRRLTRDHVRALRQAGFNRASIGVQDTNKTVQEAVHRIQPQKTNRKVTGWLREEGFSSINIDLIYGLPRQTPELFEKTLEDVLELDPDRIATYSYAHVPWIKPSQKLIREQELPSTDDKLRMMKMAVERLIDEGYRYIGMDHFAKEDDELSKAYEEDTLQRNFQGYSTRARTDLYAFGMSGISQVGSLYFQNYKDLPRYYGELDKSHWPVQKTRWLSGDDRIRREIIMQIMCKNFVSYDSFEERWEVSFHSYFKDEMEQLRRFAEDGLLAWYDNGFELTDEGRFFVRNIAMVFDRYLSQAKREKTFSKTV